MLTIATNTMSLALFVQQIKYFLGKSDLYLIHWQNGSENICRDKRDPTTSAIAGMFNALTLLLNNVKRPIIFTGFKAPLAIREVEKLASLPLQQYCKL